MVEDCYRYVELGFVGEIFCDLDFYLVESVEQLRYGGGQVGMGSFKFLDKFVQFVMGRWFVCGCF